MDHSLSQNPPLHWGYSTNNNNNNNSSSSSNNNNNPTSSWQPILINNNNNNNSNNNNHHRGTKRPLSESDCDDAYSEESSKDQCTSPGDTDSCQMLSRKKRRGVIEKKRRDRINMSLSELKRLVPSAFEKQGSAKLEKAEILALTVDHLKSLHAKGLDSLAFEQQKYAVDYHGMGFRECLAEVTRYLDRVEGMDPQNPMRLRLTSHLQCCAAQKELQLKQATSVPPWTPYGSPHHHQTYPTASTLNPLSSPSNHHHHPHQLSSLPPSSSSSSLHHHHHHHHPHSQQMHQAVDLGGHYDVSTSCAQNILTPLTPTESNRLAPPPSATSTLLTPLTTTTSSALAYSPHHQYPPPSSSSVMNSFGLPPSSSSSSASSSHNQNNYSQSIPNSQGMKPYRPWGAEVAY